MDAFVVLLTLFGSRRLIVDGNQSGYAALARLNNLLCRGSFGRHLPRPVAKAQMIVFGPVHLVINDLLDQMGCALASEWSGADLRLGNGRHTSCGGYADQQ